MATNIEQQWANSNLDRELSSLPTDTQTTSSQSSLTDKIFGLSEAKQEKIEKLSNKTYDSMEAFTGALRDKNISGVNYDSAEALQYNLGQIANYVLQTDPVTGQRFYNDPSGNRVDYHGKAIGLYMAPGRAEDSNKLGLRAEGKSFQERYEPDWKQYVPFLQGYGWKPGQEGVDPEKDPYLDIEVPEMLGREFEKYVHSNAGQLAERTAGQGPISKEWENRLGAGKSEYTSGNAPLYNIDYDVGSVKIEAGTPLPGETHSSKVGTFDAEGNYIKPDTDGYFGNLVDAAQFGLGSAAARIGDAAGDLLSRTAKEVYKALPGDATEEQASIAIGKALQGVGYDEKGNFIALDKYKNPEEYGYDQGRITAYVDEFKTTMSDPKATLLDKALVTFKAIPQGPEVLTSSLGDMLLGMTGIPGLALMATGQTNEILQQRAKNKGTQDLGVSDYGIALASGVMYSAVNMLTKGNVGFADAQKTILEAAKHMDGPAVAAVVTKLTKNGLGEGLEEIFQGVTEVVGQKLLTPKQDEILTEKTALELGAQGALGFGGGVTGAVAGEVKPAGIATALKDTATKVLNKEPKPIAKEEEEPEVLSGKDAEAIYDKADKVFSVVDDVKVAPSEKLSALRELEEQAYRIDDKEPAKEHLLEAIKAEKARFAKDIEDTEDVTEYTKVLGSKQGFLDLLDDVMEGTDNVLSEKLETNLKKIAESFGITDEQFVKIKKDYETVELEATKSSKGYLTQGKALRNILSSENPDTRKAEKLLNRMRNFEKSQVKWLESYENTVTQLEKTVNEYNSDVKKGLSNVAVAPKQVKIPGTTNNINVKELSDGTYEIDYKGIDQIKIAKDRNIKGIRSEIAKSKDLLSKAGIKQATTGIQEEAIIDTESISNKGLKAAVESVKKDFEKHKINSIIVSDKRTKRDEHILRDNEQITNKGEYTSNDVVTILVPNIKKDEDFDDFMYLLRAKKNISQFKKEIMAAQRAGATIVLDKVLKEHEGKPAKKFPYAKDSNNKQIYKSVREALISQMANFIEKDNSYAPTHFGSRVFKPTNVLAEEKKATQAAKEEKEALDAKKAELLDKSFEEFVKTKKVNYNKEINEYFQTKEKFTNYLNYRVEKEVAEYVAINENAEKYEKRSENKKTKAENSDSISESNKLILEAKEFEKKAKKERDKLKDFSLIEDIALIQIEENAVNKKQHKDLLNNYREAVMLDEINGTETAKGLLEANQVDVIGAILKGSVSKGSKIVTINKKDYITDINELVKKSKDTVLNIMEVEDMFDEADVSGTGIDISSYDYIKDAVEYLNDTITSVKFGKDTKYGDLTELEVTLANSPAYGLLFGKDGINKSVVMAMKLALDEYISYKHRLLNPGSKTKEDVAQMLGIMESQLGKNQFRLLKDKGVFKKTIDTDLGKAVMGKLGLSKANGIEDESYNRLVAELGQIATMIGLHAKILVRDEVSIVEYTNAIKTDNPSKYYDKDTSGFKGEPSIRFIKFNVEAEEDIQNGVAIYETVHNMIGDEASFRKEPKRRKIDHKYRRNTKEQVSKDVTGAKIPSSTAKGNVSALEAINNLVDIEWEYDEQLIEEIVEMYESSPEVLMKLIGYKSEDELGAMTYESREAAKSSNREIERNLQELVNLLENPGSNNKLFFDWFYTSNGRYMMDSNTINPQTEKQLHRWLVTPSKHSLNYLYKDGKFTVDGKDITAEVKYALAQSMGFAVDKESTAKINAFAELLLGMTEDDLIDAKETLLINGEKYLLGEYAIKVDHLGHSLQGFKFLLDAKTSKNGKFKSSLSAEFDAVTSGLGLKLLQMPILKNVSKDRLKNIPSPIWYWLNKVGIFKTSQMKGIDSMNDVLDSTGFYTGDDSRFYDSYQSLAVDMNVDIASLPARSKESIFSKVKFDNVVNVYIGLKDTMPSLDADNKVSKALRDLFKDPFMTFNYSAGIRSIRTSLAYKMMNDLLDGIVADKEGFEKAAIFLAKEIGKDVDEFKNLLRSKPPTGIEIEGTKLSLEDVLLKTFDSAYGSKVEEIMTNNFGEFMEAHKVINASFRSMFEMFNIKYKKALAEVPTGELTSDKKLEIINELRKEFPVIKGPLSEGIEDGIHIYTTSSITPTTEEERQAPAQTHIKTKNGVEQEKARFKIREFEAAISSGSVVPIHYIDAAVMAQLLGEGTAITAIHDAIIPPLDKARDTIKTYNESMIKIGKEYSIINAINDMMSRVQYTEDEIKEANSKIINVPNSQGDYEDIGVGKYFNDVKKRVEALNETVTAARKELFDEMETDTVMVGHMAGLPGSMWTNAVQEEVKEEPAIMSQLDKIQQKLRTLYPVSDEMEQVLNSMSDEQIEAIIEQIECKG